MLRAAARLSASEPFRGRRGGRSAPGPPTEAAGYSPLSTGASTLTPESAVTRDEAGRLLAEASAARVLVVGDVMLDRYLMGEVGRISPEAPVPVVRVTRHRRALGGAANVAAGVRALGGACRLVGAVGRDRSAAAARRLLDRRGIDPDDLVTASDRPTTVKTRVLARQQQMLRIDRETAEPLPEDTAAALSERALDALEWANALVLEDYDKGALRPGAVERLLAAARERGILSIVDPKLRNFFRFQGATVFKPNARELAAALGQEEMSAAGRELRSVAERLRCRNLLVTLGEAGMLLMEEGASEPVRIASDAREVYDVSGAGDTVTAVLAVSLASGAAPLRRAAALANFAAGVQVSRLGARPIATREILAGLRDRGTQPEPGARAEHTDGRPDVGVRASGALTREEEG